MGGNRDAAIERLRDLALRLLDPALHPRAPEDEPQLFEGALPPDLRVTLPVPENSHLVGSYVDHEKIVQVLLDVSMSRDSVFAYYDEQLTATGWTRIVQRPSLGGFEATGKRRSGPEEGGTYCRSAHGPSLTIRGVATFEDQTAVTLIFQTDPLRTPCAAPGEPAGSDPAIPVLVPPPNAQQFPRFRAGSTTSARLEAQLITDLDRRSVVSHYARQLEQAGWKPQREEERDAGAWGTWTYRADDMADRYGILFLSILHHPGHPPSYGAATDLTERPEIVEQYWLEVRTVWRAANGASAEAPTPSTTNNSQ